MDKWSIRVSYNRSGYTAYEVFAKLTTLIRIVIIIIINNVTILFRARERRKIGGECLPRSYYSPVVCDCVCMCVCVCTRKVKKQVGEREKSV